MNRRAISLLCRAAPPHSGRCCDGWGHVIPAGSTFIDSADGGPKGVSVRALLSDEFRRDSLALWSAFFACLLAVYLGFNWIPSLLIEGGLAPAVGGAGTTAFNLGGVAGALLGALAVARFGSRSTMLALSAGAAFSALAMRAMPITSAAATGPIVAMLALVGGFVNAVQVTLYSLAAHVYPTAVRATGVGAAVALGRGGAILSAYAGAWALDLGGSRAFLALLAGAMAIVFMALASIGRHMPGRSSQA